MLADSGTWPGACHARLLRFADPVAKAYNAYMHADPAPELTRALTDGVVGDARVAAYEVHPDGIYAVGVIVPPFGEVLAVEARWTNGRWAWDGSGGVACIGWSLTSDVESGEPALGVLYEARRRRGDATWMLECRWDTPPPPPVLGPGTRGFAEAMFEGIRGAAIVSFEEAPDANFVVGLVEGDDGTTWLVSGYLAHGGWVRHSCTARLDPVQLDVAAFADGGPTLGVVVTPRRVGAGFEVDCRWDPPAA
jgi:hypothetical protein